MSDQTPVANTATVDSGFKPQKAEHIAYVLFDDEMVAYDETSRSVAILSSTAMLLWQCFDGASTLSEIAADIADIFHISLETAEADCVAAAQDIADLGMLQGLAADPEARLMRLLSRSQQAPCPDDEPLDS